MKYGVWYDDGHVDLGWLNFEGGNGRVYRFEFDDEAEAQERADHEAFVDKKRVYVPMPLSGNFLERVERARKLAKTKFG